MFESKYRPRCNRFCDCFLYKIQVVRRHELAQVKFGPVICRLQKTAPIKLMHMRPVWAHAVDNFGSGTYERSQPLFTFIAGMFRVNLWRDVRGRM